MNRINLNIPSVIVKLLWSVFLCVIIGFLIGLTMFFPKILIPIIILFFVLRLIFQEDDPDPNETPDDPEPIHTARLVRKGET